MGIHPQHYSRYSGQLSPGNAWWVIARTQFRLMFTWTRTKIALAIALLPSFIMLLGAVGETGLEQQASNADLSKGKAMALAYYLRYQAFALSFVYVVSACTAISEDLRHRTLQLFFTRPVTRNEYIAGKWLGLFMLGAIVSFVPHVLIQSIRVVYSVPTDLLKSTVTQTVISSALSAGMTAVLAGIVVGVSAFSRRTAYAVLGWIGVLTIPTVIHLILLPVVPDSDWPALLSLPGNIWLVTEISLVETHPDFWTTAPFTILLFGGAGCLWAARQRLLDLETITS